MPKQFIKPNSHAQVQGRHSVDVVRAICERAGITKEEWLELLFETGCRFAHHREPHHPAAVKTLTNPEEGFWKFWIAKWIADDKELLDIGCEFSPEYYSDLKNSFVKPSTILAV